MCVIAFKPVGKEYDDEHLFNCFMNNDDGCGYIIYDGSRLYIKKGIMEYTDFEHEYLTNIKPIQKDVKCALHFRIATHGTIKPENTHPFWVRQNSIAMMHNGILDIIPPKDEDITDSEAFSRIARRFGPNFIGDPDLMSWVADSIGYNKVLFMDRNGRVNILNSKQGTWDKETGVWFSNNSYDYLWSYSYFGGGRGRSYTHKNGNKSTDYSVSNINVTKPVQRTCNSTSWLYEDERKNWVNLLSFNKELVNVLGFTNEVNFNTGSLTLGAARAMQKAGCLHAKISHVIAWLIAKETSLVAPEYNSAHTMRQEFVNKDPDVFIDALSSVFSTIYCDECHSVIAPEEIVFNAEFSEFQCPQCESIKTIEFLETIWK